MKRIFEIENLSTDLRSIYMIERYEDSISIRITGGETKTFYFTWYKKDPEDKKLKHQTEELYNAWKEYHESS